MSSKENRMTFSLQTPPLFYVCGDLEMNSSWQHKHMYQDGNWEVIFVITGKLYLSIEDEKYCIEQDCFLLVPPFKNIVGYKDSPLGTEMLWIHFFPKEPVIDVAHDSLDGYHCITLPQQGRLFDRNSVLIEAYHVLNLAQKTSGYALDVAVCQLLIILSSDYHQAILQEQGPDSTLDNVDKWITAHLDRIQSNRDIGIAFNFNPVYLNKIFKNKHHISLYQYVLSKRIEKAEELLISTSLPIADVAQQSYFNDKRNFLRIFKKRLGITPEAYRKLFTRKFINSPTYDPEIPVSDSLKKEIQLANQGEPEPLNN